MRKAQIQMAAAPLAAASLPRGVREVSGSLAGNGLRIGMVVSRFNREMTDALCATALQVLVEHGVSARNITVVRVPGAFEIPLALDRLARRRPDALIALGVVIRGETPHAELITNTVTDALARIGLAHGIPVIDGVVATHNERQARVRTQDTRHSRGAHAARAALEMAQVVRALAKGARS